MADWSLEERARRARAHEAWTHVEEKAAEDQPKAALARLVHAFAICLLDLRKRVEHAQATADAASRKTKGSGGWGGG